MEGEALDGVGYLQHPDGPRGYYAVILGEHGGQGMELLDRMSHRHYLCESEMILIRRNVIATILLCSIRWTRLPETLVGQRNLADLIWWLGNLGEGQWG